ncbi:hypothetical protein OSI08_06815 [Mycobacterium ulcerans]
MWSERLNSRSAQYWGAVALARWKAEHLADDLPRQWAGEGIDGVGGHRPGQHCVQQLIDDRDDPRPQLFDSPPAQCLGEQPADPGVIGRVNQRRDELQLEDVELGGRQPGGVRAVHVPADSRVVQHSLGIVVAGDDNRRVAAGKPHVGDRAPLPEFAEIPRRRQRVRLSEWVVRCSIGFRIGQNVTPSDLETDM